MYLSIVPFFVVLFISLVASFIASKRQKDYFLASRSLGWPLLVGTLVGTQVGGGFILGNTDSSFSQGIFGGLYGIGIALGMLGLGLGYGARLRKLEVSTLPELLEKRYGCSWFKKAAAVISILSLGGILMCQAIGLQKFLLSCGYGNFVFFLVWCAVVVYTTYGGLLAVVWTDTIQASVMIGILTLVGIFAISPYSSEIISQAQAFQAPFDAKMFSALLMPLCFMFVEQDMAQRCFSAKSPKDATVGSLVTAVLLVCLTIIPTSCGILGKALGVSPDQGSIFIQVMQKIANPVVFTLAASAVLLAIISTSSSLLLAVSSNVAQDLYSNKLKNGEFADAEHARFDSEKIGPLLDIGAVFSGSKMACSAKEKTNSSACLSIAKRQNCKTYTALIGIIALAGPYLANDIISGLVASYEISVAAFFVPLMAAIFSKKGMLPREAAWSSAVFGLAGFCCSKMLPQVPATSLVSLSLSLIGFLTGMAYGRIFKKVASQA